jgi:hypothetical protein
MKFHRRVACLVTFLAAFSAVAGVPDLVSYQGRITDASGQSVTASTTLRFRIYRGGDDQTFPSSGSLVYHETTTVSPTVEGVFSHFIGSGTPAGGCAEGSCALSAGDFADGSIPAWIEVMVDPDGTLGSQDDDVLLPRIRIGSVGFAYRVSSIEGAAGGELSGDLTAEHVTARSGLTLGRGTAEDVGLSFDQGPGADPELGWDADSGRFRFSDGAHEITVPGISGELIVGDGAQMLGGTKTFSSELFLGQGLTMLAGEALRHGPVLNPVAGASIRAQTTSASFFDGNLDGTADVDHVWMVCYNCKEGSTEIEIPDEYSMYFAYEMTYAPQDGHRWVEHNWEFEAPGQPKFRPHAFVLDTDYAGGYANPTAKWIFSTNRTTVGMVIQPSGKVRVGDATYPGRALEVGGTGDMLIDAPSHLYFEGATDDAAQTRLQAVDPTAARVIELPDRDGRLAVAGQTGGTWIVLAGDGGNTEFDSGVEVCATTSMVCDKTIDFDSATEYDCVVTHGGAGHTAAPHLFQALCRAP